MNPNKSIPDMETCYRLMERYQMPPHIRRHSIEVYKLSRAIAYMLIDKGVGIDIHEVEAAALLHDITKAKSLKSDANHAQSGASLFNCLGYPQVAEIVGQHILPQKNPNQVNAAEIVSYADKRVLHDSVVPLNERFDYLLKRYGSTEKQMQDILTMKFRMQEIEGKLTDLGIDLEELVQNSG